MNTFTMQRDWVGSVIDGRFPLLQWLGGSDASGVFLTELDGHPTRKAAIKLIPADGADAEARVAGWKATAALSHPHLMRVLHTGRCHVGAAGLHYVVTEYAEEVLSEILPERPLTAAEAREMLDPILDALFYLHGKGLVHGHLKPSNIMVVDNELKLSSDGLRAAGERGQQLEPLAVYDAPENAAGPISPAADVWSFGVTLVEALTQHPPLWERSPDREPIVPRSVPQPFSDIAQECLRLDPAQRCTLSYVKLLLDPARFMPGPARKAARTAPPRRHRTALIAIALVLVAAIALLLVRSHQSAQSTAGQPGASRPDAAQTAPSAGQQPAAAVAPPPPAPPVPQTVKGGVVKGDIAARVMPDVPERARATIDGKVMVAIRIAVDSSGDVSNATFESAGPSKYFANQALQAARRWKFTPPQVDGHAESSIWILRFKFQRTGTEVTPEEKAP